MTANERSEMISRLRMAKDLREQMKIECEQMKIECELNSITMDEVTGSMAAAGIEVPGPKKKAGGHTPGAAEMDERIRSGATFAELAAEYGVRECHITKKLRGAGYEGICHTITNAAAMISGCICDGAKASCASKIAMGVSCGILGYDMYADGNNFRPGDGILGNDVEDTIRNVGVLAAQGMRETDRVILKIMTE